MRLTDFNIEPAEQGTLEWKRARLGIFTGTKLAALMSRGRKKDEEFGTTAITQIAETASERMLNEETIGNAEELEAYLQLQCRENDAMRHGHMYEAYAANAYMIECGQDLLEVGMIYHPEIQTMAVSPDRIHLNEDGDIDYGVEIKCPSTGKTFMRYKWFIKDGESLKAEKPEYYWQIMGALAVTKANHWMFVVYSPFHDGGFHVVKIERNEEDIFEVENRVRAAEVYISSMNEDEDVNETMSPIIEERILAKEWAESHSNATLEEARLAGYSKGGYYANLKRAMFQINYDNEHKQAK